MNLPPRPLLLSLCAVTVALAPVVRAQATNWNAYGDFYLSPTAVGWTGATTPSPAGAAWGYYAANVNGFGFPTGIGSYFTPQFLGSGSQNLYQYSTVAPIGAGTVLGPVTDFIAGANNLARYQDNQGWGTAIARYDAAWFPGAPGFSQGLTNLIYMQSGWLGGGGSEGIAPVLTWTAPTNGTFTFSGLFVSGDQTGNSAVVAIIDSLGGTNLTRTVLANNTIESFTFTNTYNAGDTVQFQVGNNFSTGNAVGLQVEVVPEPSTISLIAFGFAAAALCRFRRGRMH